MKKEQPKKRVHISMTEREIKNFGYNQERKRTSRRATYWMFGFILCAIGLSFVEIWITIGFSIALVFYWVHWNMRCENAGKKLWKEVKDKPEPIILDS